MSFLNKQSKDNYISTYDFGADTIRTLSDYISKSIAEKENDKNLQEAITHSIEQQHGKCLYCSIQLYNKDKKEVYENIHNDHFLPASKFGIMTKGNLVISCDTCNLSKNSKNPLLFIKNKIENNENGLFKSFSDFLNFYNSFSKDYKENHPKLFIKAFKFSTNLNETITHKDILDFMSYIEDDYIVPSRKNQYYYDGKFKKLFDEFINDLNVEVAKTTYNDYYPRVVDFFDWLDEAIESQNRLLFDKEYRKFITELFNENEKRSDKLKRTSKTVSNKINTFLDKKSKASRH